MRAALLGIENDNLIFLGDDYADLNNFYVLEIMCYNLSIGKCVGHCNAGITSAISLCRIKKFSA